MQKLPAFMHMKAPDEKKKKIENKFWFSVKEKEKELHQQKIDQFKDITPQKTQAILEEIKVPALEVIRDDPVKKKRNIENY